MPESPNAPSIRLSPREVASLLGVAPRTVYDMGVKGRLTVFKLPSGHRRYDRAEVEALAAGGEQR